MKYFVTILILGLVLTAMAQQSERNSDIKNPEIDPANEQESLQDSNRDKRGYFGNGYGYSAPYFYGGYNSYYRRPHYYHRKHHYPYYGYKSHYHYY